MFQLLKAVKSLVEDKSLDELEGTYPGFTEEEARMLDEWGFVPIAKETIRMLQSPFGSSWDLHITVIPQGAIEVSSLPNLAGADGISVSRHIYKDFVYHGLLKIDDATPGDTKEKAGRGLAKSLFKSYLTLYGLMKLDRIETRASRIGRYAWAKFGFNASKGQISTFYRRMGNLYENLPTEVPDHMAYLAAVSVHPGDFGSLNISPDTLNSLKQEGDMWFFSDGSFKLGKFFLLKYTTADDNWRGTLKLSGVDRSICAKYVYT